MAAKFRDPDEIEKKERRTPISARIKVSTLKIIQSAAKGPGKTVAGLIEEALDDYAKFLASRPRKKR